MKAHFKTIKVSLKILSISLNKNYTTETFRIQKRISHHKQQLVILHLDKDSKFSRI